VKKKSEKTEKISEEKKTTKKKGDKGKDKEDEAILNEDSDDSGEYYDINKYMIGYESGEDDQEKDSKQEKVKKDKKSNENQKENTTATAPNSETTSTFKKLNQSDVVTRSTSKGFRQTLSDFFSSFGSKKKNLPRHPSFNLSHLLLKTKNQIKNKSNTVY